MKHTIDYFRSLLRRGTEDPEVLALTKTSSQQITRYEHTGYVDLKDQGISVLFKTADRVTKGQPKGDSQEALLLSAFHFHSDGHEGHSEYFGELPAGLRFGDDEDALTAKLGAPKESGGGGYSKLLKKPIPRWLRYYLDDEVLHLQLSAEGRLEMASLFVQDQLQTI